MSSNYHKFILNNQNETHVKKRIYNFYLHKYTFYLPAIYTFYLHTIIYGEKYDKIF